MPGGHSKLGKKVQAAEQLRQKSESLTAAGLVNFTFMMTDDGPELTGEEELSHILFDLFQEHDIFGKAKQIQMKGNALNHSSTRKIKISRLQDVFQTHLMPLPISIPKLTDNDLIKQIFAKMIECEGFKTDWVTGDDPTESVKEWWGNEDFDIFRLINGQTFPPKMVELVRNKYNQTCISFIKTKLVACYAFRLGGESKVNLYTMKMTEQELDAILRRREEEGEAPAAPAPAAPALCSCRRST